MKDKKIVSVSEIRITPVANSGYNYGFTVQFADGEIHNILQTSLRKDDEVILEKMNSERDKYLQKVSLKGDQK